ncbi:aurora kinase A and ninein-interacting protein [Silurus meridionalis]|uniref:Aurora kinase A and ninein-interacting protein n=1 Tax=Silurus meridionalis TaxID=175797 RepID=A0A8T0AHX6_SILME|nr:aurora kinase A and ninein-interacting protein [Silurus meridionalis]KAF7691152.1 hypothetical protein HF521_011449 [Silurus meridionalis]
MKRGHSKGWKTAASAGGQEECGVWLDAAALREKKQRKAVRPISKLLNPLARAGGYSMAVALNFTQTKMEMPATKQSTISKFFLPQSKKKKDAEDSSFMLPSGMSSTPLPAAHTGTKRKRKMIFELTSELENVSGCSSLIDQQGYDAGIERASGEVCNEEDKEQQFLHLLWGYQSEECEPAGKRRTDNITVETQNESSKAITVAWPKEVTESLHTYQKHHENLWIRRNICAENSDGSSTSLSADDVYTQEHVLQKNTSRSTTEIRNMTKHLKSYNGPEIFKQKHQWSPVKRDDDENNRPTSLITARSPFKQKVCSSPAKHSSDLNRKLCQTPKKSIREARENDEDSYSTLFTQDSEGFRVIAHRRKQSRCPLTDQTNSRESRENMSILSVRFLETENSDLEPEMLFTEDSQGNMVIKH